MVFKKKRDTEAKKVFKRITRCDLSLKYFSQYASFAIMFLSPTCFNKTSHKIVHIFFSVFCRREMYFYICILVCCRFMYQKLGRTKKKIFDRLSKSEDESSCREIFYKKCPLHLNRSVRIKFSFLYLTKIFMKYFMTYKSTLTTFGLPFTIYTYDKKMYLIESIIGDSFICYQ